MTTTPPGYHHGDLRSALLDEALSQLSQEQEISLRQLAKAAGVTPAAVYRHFVSKEVLLAAIAEEGFKLLETAFSEKLNPDYNDYDNWIGLGEAYVDFALAHPTHYPLMFAGFLWNDLHHAALMQTSAKSFAPLLRLCDKISGNEADAQALALMSWSAMHGYALLHLQGQAKLFNQPPPSIEHLLRQYLIP